MATEEGIMTAEPEEGQDELGTWLSKWGLQDLVKLLRAKGVKSPADFQYIKSQNQFDKLASGLGDRISFMDSCKLEDAWRSVVPNPQQPSPQVHFLGEDEKKILNKLNQRFDCLSNDINYVKKSFEAFNQSVQQRENDVNDKADTMLAIINTKRKELLSDIDSIRQKNQKIYDDKLEQLNKINIMFKHSKQIFTEIATNTDITASNRLQQLHGLLLGKLDDKHISDDEKKTENGSNAQFKMFAEKCIVPDQVSFTFDAESFKSHVNANFIIKCDNKATKWHLQYNNYDIRRDEFIFDVVGRDYFLITQNGTVITGKGSCCYGVVSTNTSFNQGIHQWKIKSVRRRCCPHDMGVITDITRLSEVGISTGNAAEMKPTGYCYMLRSCSSVVAYYNGTEVEKKNCDKAMKEGDIITLILNCNDWNLTILANGEIMGTLNIEKNRSYHPFVNTDGCCSQQYQLITNNTVFMNASFVFDQYEKDCFSISSHGTIVTGKKGCEYSIVTTGMSFNQGIHRWNIKINQKGHVYLDIGVITDITKLTELGRSSVSASQLKCTGYCYLWYYGTTLGGFYNGESLQQKHVNNGLEQGDIVTIVLNCVDWTLTFSKDNEEVGTLQLAQNESYYPTVHSCACSVQEFQLL